MGMDPRTAASAAKIAHPVGVTVQNAQRLAATGARAAGVTLTVDMIHRTAVITNAVSVLIPVHT